MKPLNLAVLVSGSGTTLQNLIDQIRAGALKANITSVIGSRADLPAEQRARDARLNYVVVDRSNADFGREVLDHCAGADLVCLAGWLCLLPVPANFAGQIMNIHPALLPAFGGRGMYGRHVHQAVLDYGCKVSGCTVHFVDGAYDAGPIILQKTCPVKEDDTAQSLAARVFELEKTAYPEAIRLFQSGSLRIEGRRVRITAPAGSST
jgi:phosphoribosylglycinamide formyltransferase-1